ncbi:hypothetical protein FQA39_LY03878 [Lamprigera yunnana]|nr:hypothetical protein FQA39_LY03878 [Lamprigera yunnana]
MEVIPKSKKRTADPSKYKRNVIKKSCLEGNAYIKYEYRQVSSKVFGLPCWKLGAMENSCGRKFVTFTSNEFVIEVPWGQVAAKGWGEESKTLVLVVHGLGDNAATFDQLIPLLPTSLYYVCIDLPSHGKSSRFPGDVLICGYDYLLTFRLVLKHLNREKCILLGHSYGAQLLTIFAQLYPECVNKLILLDSYYFFPHESEKFVDGLRDSVESLLKLRNRKDRSYSYNEAVERIARGRSFGTPLDEKSAKALAERGLLSVGNEKYQFSSDPRLRIIINPFLDFDIVVKMLKEYPFTFPCLFLYTKETSKMYVLNSIPILEVLNSLENCQVVEIKGSHDVHSMDPKSVSPIIRKFLTESKNKL